MKEFSVGEGHGAGGVLRALVLINRYADGKYTDLIDDMCEVLSGIDVSKIDQTDKASGLAGLLTTLCRYEALYSKPGILDLIRSSGKRLEELKTLDYEGLKVWKTISEMNYPLSGAVHGMAGIAEALYMADVRLGTDEFAASAHDALLFEDMTYSEKLGGWEDRRVPGVHKLSGGNCYGASGMAILFDRMLNAGVEDELINKNLAKARETVKNNSIMPQDHLCCGNMSFVDYYLETGLYEAAGKKLASVIRRKNFRGKYNVGVSGCLPNDNLDLFYGLAGIGYELLRYASPDSLLTIL